MSNKNSSEGKKLKKKTSAKIEVPVRDLINNFIVFNDTSFIYEVMTEKNDLGKLLLRKGNMYLKFDRKTIQQGLVDGKYRRPNEHELKKHLIKEQEYFQELTSKLVHRIILAQALIECNDDLRDDYADDKYISNILEKSTKQLERLATAAYNNMFKTDPKILTYFLEEVQNAGKRLGKISPHNFAGIGPLLNEFEKDPNKYIPEIVYVKKLE